MNSETFDESKIESDSHKDSINGHSGRKSLVKKDSQFKITTPNCKVLQHLVRPAAMVAVPTVLTEEENTAETKDDVSQYMHIYTYTMLDYSYCFQCYLILFHTTYIIDPIDD
jgi:hypothetical protein